MIFPPIDHGYEFNNHCTAEDNINCDKEFKCGSCALANKTYEKDIRENYEDFVIPCNTHTSRNGIVFLVSASVTVSKFKNIDDVKNFLKHDFPSEEITEERMQQDELKMRYPYWYALRVLENWGEPLRYLSGKNIPLVVEYDYCAFMVTPVIEYEG